MATNPEALEVIPPSIVPGEKKTAAGPGPVYRYDDYDEDIQGEYPTEEEFHTLRRVADKIPFAIYTIAFIELCERFSYYGTTVVCKLIIFHPPPPSPLVGEFEHELAIEMLHSSLVQPLSTPNLHS